MRLSTAIALLILVFTPGCANYEELSNLLATAYWGEIDEDTLNRVIVKDVESGSALMIRFYECNGSQQANAFLGGSIDTVRGDVHGLATIVDIERDGDKLRGTLNYEDTDYQVDGEFLDNRTVFKAQVFGLGEMTLDRVETESPEDTDGEKNCE